MLPPTGSCSRELRPEGVRLRLAMRCTHTHTHTHHHLLTLQSKDVATSLMGEPVLVFDNGGGALKAGWSTDAQPFVMHNFTARSKSDKRIYVGDDVRPRSFSAC